MPIPGLLNGLTDYFKQTSIRDETGRVAKFFIDDLAGDACQYFEGKLEDALVNPETEGFISKGADVGKTIKTMKSDK